MTQTEIKTPSPRQGSIVNEKKGLRYRTVVTVIGSLVAIIFLFLTSPSLDLIKVPFGAEIISKLSALPATAIGVALLFIGVKTLYDYVDGSALITKAAESSTGAGLVAVAIAISRLAVALVIMAMLALFS